MMFLLSFPGRTQESNNNGKVVVAFACLQDALDAAIALKSAGIQRVFVTDTKDPDNRYLIPPI